MPAEQVEQLVRELVSSLPAAQVIQELCPVPGWYLPDAQVLHELDRAELEYRPEVHERQEL